MSKRIIKKYHSKSNSVFNYNNHPLLLGRSPNAVPLSSARELSVLNSAIQLETEDNKDM